MTPEVHRFDAFISYSHADESAARRIQNFLEHYKLPTDIAPGRRRLRVFRDATDIRTGALSEELNAALDASRSLVVCCSPGVLNSTWVSQEIDRFLDHDGTRPIVPVLLQGEAASSIPERLKPFNHRFADLRSAWIAGWLKPKARDELIRALATISGSELRRLIPWEKRRRRRAMIYCAAVLSIVALTIALFPIESARKLDQPQAIGADQTIEYCDVVGDRLVLGARQKIKKQNAENTNDVQYVMLYDDALNPANKGTYLDRTVYVARNRLIHASQLRSAQRIIEKTDRARLYEQARRMAEEKYDFAPDDKLRFEGVWAAEPRPGLSILLYRIKPSPLEGADGPAAGNSIVAVSENGNPWRLMSVDGLYPPKIGDTSISPRGAALMDGLPIVASGKSIFIGMSIRNDGGLGGLWRWDGAGSNWELQKIPRSVYSMIADPRKPGRVLLSTAPAPWESDARKGEIVARFFERANESSDWREIQLLPVDSKAQVQLCGFRSDGTLYLRHQQALHALGTQRLYQRQL